MTDIINYTLVNATSLSQAMDQTSNSFDAATGFPLFMPFIWLTFVLAGVVLGSKWGFEKALPYSLFMGDIVAFFLVGAGLMEPVILILSLAVSIPVIFAMRD